jgi:hypothetical protein
MRIILIQLKQTGSGKNPMVLDADEMVKNITINKEHADKFDLY